MPGLFHASGSSQRQGRPATGSCPSRFQVIWWYKLLACEICRPQPTAGGARQRRGARHKRPWGQHSTLARAHAPEPGSCIWSSFLLQKAMLGTGVSQRSTWSVLQGLQGKPLRGTSFPNLAPTSKPNFHSESDTRHWSLPAEHLVRPSGALRGTRFLSLATAFQANFFSVQKATLGRTWSALQEHGGKALRGTRFPSLAAAFEANFFSVQKATTGAQVHLS